MKSLLDLLKEEDTAVRGVEQAKRDLNCYKDRLKVASACNIKCICRDDDIRHYEEMVENYDKAILAGLDSIIHIREQIRLVIMGIKP